MYRNYLISMYLILQIIIFLFRYLFLENNFKMSSKLDTVKVAIKDSLYDESKPWCKFFNWAETTSGVNRLNLFMGKKYKLKIILVRYVY